METENGVSAPQNFNTAAQYLSQIYEDPSLHQEGREDVREAAEALAVQMGYTLALQKPFPGRVKDVSSHLSEKLHRHFYEGTVIGFTTLLAEAKGQGDRHRFQSMLHAVQKERDRAPQ